MGHKLKTLIVSLVVILAVLWHHQATLFQRQIRENLNLLKNCLGPTVQLGDVIISKYLFKVEFKKPQIDISIQSLEKIKSHLLKENFFGSKFIKDQLDRISPNFRLIYRLADRLTISYNPVWHELAISSTGDGELNLQTETTKIDLIAPDSNDYNQSKIKIFLPSPKWLKKNQKVLFER